MEVLISPNFPASKLLSGSIDDRIDVYEDRLKGWFFEPLLALLQVPNAAIAIIQLCLGYFEAYWIYRTGEDSKRRSKEFFKRAFNEIFSDLRPVDPPDLTLPRDIRDRLANLHYEDGRCGLFHDGILRGNIFVGRSSAPISVTIEKKTGEVAGILIDPKMFLDEIMTHSRQYIDELRNPSNTDSRTKFNKAWELKNPDIAGVLHPKALKES